MRTGTLTSPKEMVPLQIARIDFSLPNRPGTKTRRPCFKIGGADTYNAETGRIRPEKLIPYQGVSVRGRLFAGLGAWPGF
jgi:hypothetical protein